ncbi:MAG: hypothetical protein ACPL7D_12895 [Candidatus Sumerlaeaceae bacterium]
MAKRTRLAASLLWLLFAVALFSGCQGLTARQGRPDYDLEFRSPLAPVTGEIRSPHDVRDVLAKRARAIRGLRARAEIFIGRGGRRSPRQRFDALAYVDPPDFLRVRASQSGAGVFDLLVKDGFATAVIIPEKMVVTGPLAELERAPEILGGMAPTQVFDAVDVEALLLRRLESDPAEFYPARDRLHFWFRNERQMREQEFVVRRRDLLVERLTMWQGRRKMGEIRFWAYEQVADGNSVVPVEFAIENAKGGAFLVRLSEVRLDQPRSPELATIEIPEGFAKQSLKAAH